MINKKPLIFSGIFLYINEKKLEVEDFKNVLGQGSYTNKEDIKIQIFDIAYENNFLKIKFGDGAVGSRNPFVYNFDKEEEEPNPREKNQVEPKETFALIDFNTSYMWISNSRKRNALILLIKSYFKTSTVTAKDIYDENEFLNTLKKIDNIRFSGTPNLLSQTGVLSSALTDEINGYEATTASVSFSYQQRLTSDYIIEKIKGLFSEKNSLKNIVISGRDEKNLGMLFNTEGFSRKIEIEAEVNIDEMFSSDDVFKQIIQKLKNESS